MNAVSPKIAILSESIGCQPADTHEHQPSLYISSQHWTTTSNCSKQSWNRCNRSSELRHQKQQENDPGTWEPMGRRSNERGDNRSQFDVHPLRLPWYEWEKRRLVAWHVAICGASIGKRPRSFLVLFGLGYIVPPPPCLHGVAWIRQPSPDRTSATAAIFSSYGIL
jgi:hypothetical protein